MTHLEIHKILNLHGVKSSAEYEVTCAAMQRLVNLFTTTKYEFPGVRWVNVTHTS